MAARRRPSIPTVRRGFTLVEAVVALSVLTIVLGATTSLVIIASRGLEGGADEIALVRAESTMLDLRRDVRLALVVNERSTNAFEVVVPDRDGDGDPETIRWSWSGVAGAPLLRSWNGGAAETMLEDVTAFSFDVTAMPADDSDDLSDAGVDAGGGDTERK